MAAMSKRLVGSIVAIVLLAGLLPLVSTSQADTGVVRAMIAGALASPIGTSGDGQITLRIGVSLPVSLVSDGAVVPGTIGTATFAQWSDTMPSAGFGPSSTLMVFRLGGGLTLVAGGIATPSGLVTTFSATVPLDTLSGTWTLAGGTGVTGAGADDAVVTFTFDTNPHITVSGVVSFVASGVLSSGVNKSIPGVASVGVVRNVPVFEVVGNAKGAHVGTVTTYSASNIVGHASETVNLNAIDFGGGVFVLSGCVFPDSLTACLVGATGPAAHLSGRVASFPGESSIGVIAGVTVSDVILRLTGSLP